MSTIPLHASRIFQFPERIELGPELLVNADFSNGLSGWTVTGNDATHTVTAVAGGARFVSDTLSPILYLGQGLATLPTPGTYMMVAVEFSTITSGFARVSIPLAGGGEAAAQRPGTGLQPLYLISPVSNQILILRASTNVDVVIKRASVRAIINS